MVDVWLLSIVLTVVTCIALSSIAYYRKILDRNGCILAFVMGMVIGLMGSVVWLVLLLIFLFSSFAATRYRYQLKKKRKVAEPKGGRRGFENVLANGYVPMVIALLTFHYPEPIPHIDGTVASVMFITAIAALPIWNWISKKTSKRQAYIYGMGFWMIVQLLLIVVRPGQTAFIISLTVLAGISISTAHVLPDAIFPDVIEWEELRTKKRNEGVYYGVKNFSRKLSGALTIFLVLQALGWFGYQSPPEGAAVFQQSDITVLVIRVLTGPFGAMLLLSSIIIAWFYPLTREKHARIRQLLVRREIRS